ncbi:uncharacterized protein LOC123869879 isoform X1 [Maniola jurtina]|uniref:uncharacterized protein LOC123869879 isoform X1 n=1 Tax=Maniola jurtina TaxID=191418 RepID=UPI001E68FAB4|nr:uncharacterized protein LOC123869879 isoform X1 [Maniola jurtina]XP_045768913.1 uncharacterized protein LOC123869879 isoform X1 [Maniola jurtina]
MGIEACSCAPAAALAAPEPDLLYDHHSSEEELEVTAVTLYIVRPAGMGGEACSCAPAAALAAPEPDLLYDHHSSEEELEVTAVTLYIVRPAGMGGEACSCAPAAALAAPEPDLLYDHHSSEEELEVTAVTLYIVRPAGMGVEACSCAPAAALAAPEPDLLYDHHSSEEELEVINGSPAPGGTAARGEGRRRGASSPARTAPEKRRWPAEPYDDELAAPAPSSDDDDTKAETPVRFRTSPPLEALKPRRAGECGCAGRAPCSPRRRRLPLPPPRRHRPALDFDKMQQLKVGGGGVRSWRAVGGAHGGELSVFCW